jgi:hypothetical protein
MSNYTPKPSMRTNPLSKTLGGSTIKIYYSGYSITYENIKNVNAYLAKLKDDKTIQSISVNGITI